MREKQKTKNKRQKRGEHSCSPERGFTLVETLVAVFLLTFSVVAPMSLASQSLSSAYYARDQVTASYLAQEAIEAVRSVRDENILRNAFGDPVNLLEGIPINQNFVIDTRDNLMNACTQTECPSLRSNGTFYAYGDVGTMNIYSSQPGWPDTRFTRTIIAQFVPDPIVESDEISVRVTMRWQTGPFQERTFSITENMYRWISTN